MFLIVSCSLILLVVEAIVGDLTDWKAAIIIAALGATAGLGLAELGLRSNR